MASLCIQVVKLVRAKNIVRTEIDHMSQCGLNYWDNPYEKYRNLGIKVND